MLSLPIMRYLFLLSSTALISGCLLISDFEGIVGGSASGSSAGRRNSDAGDDGGEEGADGGGDGESVDGGSPDGGSGDGGGGDGGGGDGAVCSGSHTFCTDFDKTTALPIPGWGSLLTQGSLSIDTSSPVSAPGALRARLLPGDAGPQATLVREVFMSTFNELKLSFDFRLNDCVAQSNAITFIYMRLATSPDFVYGFALQSSGSQSIGVQVGTKASWFPLEQPFPKGAWSHGVITVKRIDASTAQLTLTVDGVLSVNTPTNTPATVGPTLVFNVGASAAATVTSTPCDVSFDNVVFDKQ